MAKSDLFAAKATIDGLPTGALESDTPPNSRENAEGAFVGFDNPLIKLASEVEFNLGLVERDSVDPKTASARRGLAKLHFRWSNRITPTQAAAEQARGCAVSWEAARTTVVDSTSDELKSATVLLDEAPYADTGHRTKGDGRAALVDPVDRAWVVYVPIASHAYARMDVSYGSPESGCPEPTTDYHLKARRYGSVWSVTHIMMTAPRVIPKQCVCFGVDGSQWIGNGTTEGAPCDDPSCGTSLCVDATPRGLATTTFVHAMTGHAIVRVLFDSDDTDKITITTDSTALHVHGGGCDVDEPLVNVQ